MIPAPAQSQPPVADTKPSDELESTTENLDNSGDKNDNVTSPANDAPKNSASTKIWPFAAGGTLLAVFIAAVILITMNKRKKHISNFQGIDTAGSDDNGGNEE